MRIDASGEGMKILMLRTDCGSVGPSGGRVRMSSGEGGMDGTDISHWRERKRNKLFNCWGLKEGGRERGQAVSLNISQVYRLGLIRHTV